MNFPGDEYDRNRKLEFEDRILDSSNPDMVKIREAANMQRGMTWGSPDAASDAMHDFYEKIRAYASENLEKDRAIVRKAVEFFSCGIEKANIYFLSSFSRSTAFTTLSILRMDSS